MPKYHVPPSPTASSDRRSSTTPPDKRLSSVNSPDHHRSFIAPPDKRRSPTTLSVRRAPAASSDRRRRRRRAVQVPRLAVLAALVLVAGALLLWWSAGEGKKNAPDTAFSGGPVLPAGFLEHSGGIEPQTADADVPDWIVQDILPLNEWSRPGDALPQVNGVVVHYVGNPGTTAEQNRSYFGYLAQTHETSASSHFVVGMDGTIIQCVPLDEIAYCSGKRNADTISIECCHPDDTGAFTQETLDALTKLLDWLIDAYGLKREDILRHYDVSGKECPRYFYQHPDAWETFLDGLTFPDK